MIPDHAPQFTLGRQRTGRNPDSARALFAPTRRFLSSPLCRFGHYPFSSASVNLQPQRYEPSKTRSDCGSLGFILFLGRLLSRSSTASTFCKPSMSMKMVSFTTDPPPSPALHWTHHERIWYRSEAGWGQRQRLRVLWSSLIHDTMPSLSLTTLGTSPSISGIIGNDIHPYNCYRLPEVVAVSCSL